MNTESPKFAPLDAAFPVNGTVRDKLHYALSYAILAPSSHNTQPWHFVLNEQSVLICADRTRALAVADPFDRQLVMSCGAALFNLRVALTHFGCPFEITQFPYRADPDVLAELRVTPDGFLDSTIGELFLAIGRRSTNRQDFKAEPVPVDIQDGMRKAAEAEGVDIACVEPVYLREQIAELIAEGDREQFADPRFRRELAAWIHPAHLKDGIPGYSQGVSELFQMATPVVSAVIRTFDVGGGVAASHRRLVQGSPLLACLSTTMDDPAAWLAAGQALERVLLVAAKSWFDASYMNQPIEVPSLRLRLRDLVRSKAFPQILLRIGVGRAPSRSPRRPLNEVLW